MFKSKSEVVKGTEAAPLIVIKKTYKKTSAARGACFYCSAVSEISPSPTTIAATAKITPKSDAGPNS